MVKLKENSLYILFNLIALKEIEPETLNSIDIWMLRYIQNIYSCTIASNSYSFISFYSIIIFILLSIISMPLPSKSIVTPHSDSEVEPIKAIIISI
jgi:hypothetical protein